MAANDFIVSINNSQLIANALSHYNSSPNTEITAFVLESLNEHDSPVYTVLNWVSSDRTYKDRVIALQFLNAIFEKMLSYKTLSSETKVTAGINALQSIAPVIGNWFNAAAAEWRLCNAALVFMSTICAIRSNLASEVVQTMKTSFEGRLIKVLKRNKVTETESILSFLTAIVVQPKALRRLLALDILKEVLHLIPTDEALLAHELIPVFCISIIHPAIPKWERIAFFKTVPTTVLFKYVLKGSPYCNQIRNLLLTLCTNIQMGLLPRNPTAIIPTAITDVVRKSLRMENEEFLTELLKLQPRLICCLGTVNRAQWIKAVHHIFEILHSYSLNAAVYLDVLKTSDIFSRSNFTHFMKDCPQDSANLIISILLSLQKMCKTEDFLSFLPTSEVVVNFLIANEESDDAHALAEVLLTHIKLNGLPSSMQPLDLAQPGNLRSLLKASNRGRIVNAFMRALEALDKTASIQEVEAWVDFLNHPSHHSLRKTFDKLVCSFFSSGVSSSSRYVECGTVDFKSILRDFQDITFAEISEKLENEAWSFSHQFSSHLLQAEVSSAALSCLVAKLMNILDKKLTMLFIKLSDGADVFSLAVVLGRCDSLSEIQVTETSEEERLLGYIYEIPGFAIPSDISSVWVQRVFDHLQATYNHFPSIKRCLKLVNLKHVDNTLSTAVFKINRVVELVCRENDVKNLQKLFKIDAYSEDEKLAMLDHLDSVISAMDSVTDAALYLLWYLIINNPQLRLSWASKLAKATPANKTIPFALSLILCYPGDDIDCELITHLCSFDVEEELLSDIICLDPRLSQFLPSNQRRLLMSNNQEKMRTATLNLIIKKSHVIFLSFLKCEDVYHDPECSINSILRLSSLTKSFQVLAFVAKNITDCETIKVIILHVIDGIIEHSRTRSVIVCANKILSSLKTPESSFLSLPSISTIVSYIEQTPTSPVADLMFRALYMLCDMCRLSFNDLETLYSTLLSVNTSSNDYLKLLNLVLTKRPDLLSAQTARHWFWKYEGTLSESDQYILCILRHYNGDMDDIIFSQSSTCHNQTAVIEDDAMDVDDDWVTSTLENSLNRYPFHRLNKTVLNFPHERQLHFKHPSSPFSDSCVDPAFILPYTAAIIRKFGEVDVLKLRTLLSVVVACLSSADSALRSAAYFIMKTLDSPMFTPLRKEVKEENQRLPKSLIGPLSVLLLYWDGEIRKGNLFDVLQTKWKKFIGRDGYAFHRLAAMMQCAHGEISDWLIVTASLSYNLKLRDVIMSTLAKTGKDDIYCNWLLVQDFAPRENLLALALANSDLSQSAKNLLLNRVMKENFNLATISALSFLMKSLHDPCFDQLQVLIEWTAEQLFRNFVPFHSEFIASSEHCEASVELRECSEQIVDLVSFKLLNFEEEMSTAFTNSPHTLVLCFYIIGCLSKDCFINATDFLTFVRKYKYFT